MTPMKLLVLVCRYYSLGNVKQLAETARPDLWRHPAILKEAQRIACWLLKRHCDLSLEGLVQCDAVRELEWSATDLEVGIVRARRKIAEADFAFRFGMESIEQMLIWELRDCPKCATTNKKRTKKGL